MKLRLGGVLGTWITGGFFSHLLIKQQNKEYWKAKSARDFCEIVHKEEVDAPYSFRPDPRMQEPTVDSDNAGHSHYDVSFVDPYEKGSLSRRSWAEELLQVTTKDVEMKEYRLFMHGFFRNAVGYNKAEKIINSFWNK